MKKVMLILLLLSVLCCIAWQKRPSYWKSLAAKARAVEGAFGVAVHIDTTEDSISLWPHDHSGDAVEKLCNPQLGEQKDE